MIEREKCVDLGGCQDGGFTGAGQAIDANRYPEMRTVSSGWFFELAKYASCRTAPLDAGVFQFD